MPISPDLFLRFLRSSVLLSLKLFEVCEKILTFSVTSIFLKPTQPSNARQEEQCYSLQSQRILWPSPCLRASVVGFLLSFPLRTLFLCVEKVLPFGCGSAALCFKVFDLLTPDR